MYTAVVIPQALSTSVVDCTPGNMFSPRTSICLSTAAILLYVGTVSFRCAPLSRRIHHHQLITHWCTNRRRTFIDILDDDSLLYIFYHCKPVLLEEGDHDNVVLEGGRWERERWWYKLARVCRRWRHLILASPSYLGISLVCRPRTPVADMLAQSPPLPLTIDHLYGINTAEDDEGVLLALKHRDRVRRIRFQVLSPLSLEELMAAIDEKFPMLEYLYIEPLLPSDSNWSLPSKFCAPNLRHLVLSDFAFPIGCPLLVDLVTLSLKLITPSANFGPSELLQQLSLMPQLETLRITFDPRLSDEDVEEQLLQIPLSTLVTLPNLRSFVFKSPLPYMNSVLPRITMPLLKCADIEVIPPTSPGVSLSNYFVLQLVCKTESPRFRGVAITFHQRFVVVTMYPHEGIGIPTLRMQEFHCGGPVDGLLSIVRIFRAMEPVFSEVKSLTLEDATSLEWYKEFGVRTSWHGLLGLFSKVRTLHVAGGGLIKGLSCSLLPEDRETPIDVLPDLRVLSCRKGSHVGKSCRSFIAVRRNAGHPVTLARH